jgi:cysteine desulfurase
MKNPGERIYLDHNATTPLNHKVLEAMLPYLAEHFGNASSIHAEGRAARAAVDSARSQVASFLGAREEEIYFTSGGTESNNLAIQGIAGRLGKGKVRLVTSAVEHHAALKPMQRLAEKGFKLTVLPVDRYGRVEPGDLRQALQAGGTAFVSIIAASNEVGTIQPVEELGTICREHGALFHVDAVQAAGRLKLDLARLPVDLLSLSAHKIYGPKGIGVLYVRRGVKLDPLILGGSQERRIRAGTENVAGIVGLGKSCEICSAGLEESNTRLAALRDRLWQCLSKKLTGIYLNGHPTERLSNTLNVSFEGVEGEAIILNLDLKGIAASTGSACSSGSLEPSHVLTAMGVSVELVQNSVRFSLGRGNTEEEIDRTIEALIEAVTRLREI